MKLGIPISALFLTILGTALAQTPAELMNEPTVRAAFDAIKRNEPSVIQQQIKICEIPAPPFKEEVRGQELKRLFEGHFSRSLVKVQIGIPMTDSPESALDQMRPFIGLVLKSLADHLGPGWAVPQVAVAGTDKGGT